MKANELRIGNYVFSKETGYYQKIVGLTEENVYIDTITFDYPTYDEIEPIELTEEILLKCGIEQDNYYKYSFEKHPFRISNYGDVWCREIYVFNAGIEENDWMEDEQCKPIKYLHQLQNLYFALTGDELQINL